MCELNRGSTVLNEDQIKLQKKKERKFQQKLKSE